VPAHTPSVATLDSDAPEFIPPGISQVSVRRNVTVTVSDEYACWSGPTLWPSILPPTPIEIGIRLNEIRLARMVV